MMIDLYQLAIVAKKRKTGQFFGKRAEQAAGGFAVHAACKIQIEKVLKGFSRNGTRLDLGQVQSHSGKAG